MSSANKSVQNDFPAVSEGWHAFWCAIFILLAVIGSAKLFTGDSDHLWYVFAIVGISSFILELGIYAYRLTPSYELATDVQAR